MIKKFFFVLTILFFWGMALPVGAVCTTQQSVTGSGNVSLTGGTGDGTGSGCGAALTSQNISESTLVVSNSQNIGAMTLEDILTSVSTNPGNYGNLNFLGDSLVAGAVGSASKYLDTISLNGDGTKNVDFNGSVFALNFIQNDSDSSFDADAYLGNLQLGAGQLTINAPLSLLGQDNEGSATSAFTDDGTISLSGSGGVSIYSYDGENFSLDGILSTETTGTGTVTLTGSGTVQGGALGQQEFRLSSVSGGADGTSSTFDLNIYAGVFGISGTGTVTVSGVVTAPTLYASTGTLVLSDGASLVGQVSNSSNNQGVLTFLGDGSVSHFVGASNQKLNAINAGASGKTVTFSDNVFATTYNHSGTGTTNLGGVFTGTTMAFGSHDGTIVLDENKTITANITNSAVNVGTLKLSSGSTVIGSIASSNYLKQLTLLGDARLGTQASDALTIKVKNLSLDDNTLSVYGDTTAMSFLGGGTVSLTISDLENYGSILVVSTGNTNAILVPADIGIELSLNAFIPDGTQLTLIQNGVSAENVDGVLSISNAESGSRVVWNSSVSNNSLVLTAHRGTQGISGRGIEVLEAINSLSSVSGDFSTVLGLIEGFSDLEASAAYSNLLPPRTESIQRVVTNRASDIANSILQGRMENARTGINAGEDLNAAFAGREGALWFKGFSGTGRQDSLKATPYSDKTHGGLIGADFLTDSITRLGVAGGFSQVKVHTSDGLERQLIQSYRAMGYGSRDWNSSYLEGALSVSWNHYNTLRSILFPGVERIAESDNEGRELLGMLGGGFRYRYGNWRITPRGAMRYGVTSVGTYTESGAQSLNLQVLSRKDPIWQGDVGLKVTYPLQYGYYYWVPTLRAQYLYDLISSKRRVTSIFSENGLLFRTEGIYVARGGISLGAGVSVFGRGRSRLIVDYDWERKGNYRGHLFGVSLRYYLS